MKNNETGEFELVMGNKQLLSGFFIVVVLFAVFFVMGYIVGRNSTPATQAASGRDLTGTASTGGRPQPASGSAPGTQTPPSAGSEQPKDDSGGNPPVSETPATQPAQQAEAKPAPPAPPSATPAAVDPAPGDIYLQVTSVKGQDVAETVAKTLKDKGFPAVVSPGVMGQTRVLVGPYTDRAKLGQAKADLEHLGFAPFVKR